LLISTNAGGVSPNYTTTYDTTNNDMRFSTVAGGGTGGNISFLTNSSGTATERMRIDSSGNVGIGSTSPSARLQVQATNSTDANNTLTGSWVNIGSSLTSGLGIRQKGNNAGISGETFPLQIAAINVPLEIYTVSSQSLVFGTNAAERARITSGGNFLVGGTSGAARLMVKEVANLTEADPHFEITNDDYSGFHWLDATAYYIGQNSAARALRIYSSAETAGVNLAAGGTSWGTFSDERLKYDIEPITGGLTKLANVRCVSYRLKDVDEADSQKKLGVIAQDLIGVVDEVIDITKRSGDETEYMSVRYTELIPVLVKAIQELKAELDTVKAELATLKGN
jgi:hypothetical protein